MRISELSTNEAVDLLMELTPPTTSIMSDKKLHDVLAKKLNLDGKKMSVAEVYLFGAKKVTQIVPILLKDHRDDVFSIISILNNISVEEVAKQNIMVTMRQIKDMWQDKELRDFFKSVQQEEGNE